MSESRTAGDWSIPQEVTNSYERMIDSYLKATNRDGNTEELEGKIARIKKFVEGTIGKLSENIKGKKIIESDIEFIKTSLETINGYMKRFDSCAGVTKEDKIKRIVSASVVINHYITLIDSYNKISEEIIEKGRTLEDKIKNTKDYEQIKEIKDELEKLGTNKKNLEDDIKKIINPLTKISHYMKTVSSYEKSLEETTDDEVKKELKRKKERTEDKIRYIESLLNLLEERNKYLKTFAKFPGEDYNNEDIKLDKTLMPLYYNFISTHNGLLGEENKDARIDLYRQNSYFLLKNLQKNKSETGRVYNNRIKHTVHHTDGDVASEDVANFAILEEGEHSYYHEMLKEYKMVLQRIESIKKKLYLAGRFKDSKERYNNVIDKESVKNIIRNDFKYIYKALDLSLSQEPIANRENPFLPDDIILSAIKKNRDKVTKRLENLDRNKEEEVRNFDDFKNIIQSKYDTLFNTLKKNDKNFIKIFNKTPPISLVEELKKKRNKLNETMTSRIGLLRTIEEELINVKEEINKQNLTKPRKDDFVMKKNDLLKQKNEITKDIKSLKDCIWGIDNFIETKCLLEELDSITEKKGKLEYIKRRLNETKEKFRVYEVKALNRKGAQFDINMAVMRNLCAINEEFRNIFKENIIQHNM